MKYYPEDYTVEFSAPFTDLNGDTIEPTGVTAVLYDGDNAVIQDFGSVAFDGASGSVTIVVARELNVLADDEKRAARVLRVVLDTQNGSLTKTFMYAIESEQRLVIMDNSFMTLGTAEFIALDMPGASDVTGWNAATSDQKLAALTAAYRRLTSIPMKFRVIDPETTIDAWSKLVLPDLADTVRISREGWTEITKDYFDETFPDRFKAALKRAQLIEANDLLLGDTVGDKLRANIISETIGERSYTLRDGRVDYGASDKALRELTGYIDFNSRIVR